jgi:predicted NAD-dependent protein-ADP-ribosyltransferase YbiA (DUF1768 family)
LVSNSNLHTENSKLDTDTEPETEPETHTEIGATVKEYIDQKSPYPKERAHRMRKFYINREDDQKHYTYTENGDLVVYNKSGAQEELIPLRVYIPYDITTQNTRDQNRLDAIGHATTKYEEALAALRVVYEEYQTSGAMQPVLAAQKAAAEADQLLTRIRYGERGIQKVSNPKTNDILFEKSFEERKLFRQSVTESGQKDPYKNKLYRLINREFPYESFYGTYVDAPDAVPGKDVDADMEPGASENSTRQRLKDGRYARIFFDSEDGANGFLSPFWPVEYTLGDTKYFTALQAFEAARTVEAGKPELRKSILGTRSTRTMRYLTNKLEQQPKDPKAVWLGILTAIYQQHPELKEKLLGTGTDALVFADARKGPSGIGMAATDRGVLEPSRWLGENLFGIALETLRYKLREGTAAESARNDAPKEQVITTDEQAAAKTAAIITAKRKFALKGRGF